MVEQTNWPDVIEYIAFMIVLCIIVVTAIKNN